MTDNEFRLLLEAAVCGDREALDSLLALYMPLINRLSSYAGNLDEDCRQYIMLHIVLHISEFRSLKFFLRALDFAFFECFYFMKAIPFSMNLENRIAAPSRSSGGKRLSIWFGSPKPRAHKYGRQPYAR